VRYLFAFLLGDEIHLVNEAEDHRVRGGLLKGLHALLVPLEVALVDGTEPATGGRGKTVRS
jgi:hypothetical protein